MKTVKVRIAVAVDQHGNWNSCGWSGATDADKMDLCVESIEEGETRYWIEADVPVREIPVIEGKVEQA